jgi:hypothetical protein
MPCCFFDCRTIGLIHFIAIGLWEAGELRKLSEYLQHYLTISITKNYRLPISGSCTGLYGHWANSSIKKKKIKRRDINEIQGFIGGFVVLLIREERSEPNSR